MSGRRDADVQSAIDRLRPIAQAYKRDFLDRHFIIEFTAGAFDVLWRKRHFMHLCGLDCTLPQRMYRNGARPVRSEVFFDALTGGSMNGITVRHGHNPGITRDKTTALRMLMLAPKGIDLVVDSTGRDYRYFFGCDEWCVGVTLGEADPIDPDVDVHAPRTVRNVSITSRSIIRAGSRPYPVTDVRIIPPRQ